MTLVQLKYVDHIAHTVALLDKDISDEFRDKLKSLLFNHLVNLSDKQLLELSKKTRRETFLPEIK